MPIYEYACQECGNELEARQKFSDPPLTECPRCGKAGLERLVSNTSFALKGSGWYADGYGPTKGGDAKAEAGTSDASKKDGAKTDGAKADAKPAEPKKPADTKKPTESRKAS